MDTNQSDKLRPCPFCGDTKTVHRKGNTQDELGIHDPGRVYCSICGGETSYYWWQKRPIEDALQAKLDIAIEALEYCAIVYPHPDDAKQCDIAFEALKKLKGD